MTPLSKFLIASQKLDAITTGSERAFLFSTARGVAANARRSISRSREQADDVVLAQSVDEAPDPEQAAQKSQGKKLLERVLGEMTEEFEDRVRFVRARRFDVGGDRCAPRNSRRNCRVAFASRARRVSARSDCVAARGKTSMSDPIRLLASTDTTDLERELLQSWADERPASAAREKTLALLGVTGGALAAGSAVSASLLAPKALAPQVGSRRRSGLRFRSSRSRQLAWACDSSCIAEIPWRTWSHPSRRKSPRPSQRQSTSPHLRPSCKTRRRCSTP